MKNELTVIKEMRRNILLRASSAGEGHVPSALSILDILWVAYSLGSRKEQKPEDNSEVIILSKGHGSLALYEVLVTKGYFPEKQLVDFCQHDSLFGGHPDRTKIPGVVASTGSLGHGLPLAIGLALSKKLNQQPGQVIVVVGDGETNEGTTWESALLAAHHNLSNLTCVIDHNHSTDRALVVDPLVDKFKAFGWDVLEADGHDHQALRDSLLFRSSRPVVVVAQTVKGRGIPEMEGNPAWHHGVPSGAALDHMLETLA